MSCAPCELVAHKFGKDIAQEFERLAHVTHIQKRSIWHSCGDTFVSHGLSSALLQSPNHGGALWGKGGGGN